MGNFIPQTEGLQRFSMRQKLTLVLKVKPFKFEPLFECLHTENFINVDIQIVTYLRATKTSNGSCQLEYDTSSLLLKPLSTYRIHT